MKQGFEFSGVLQLLISHAGRYSSQTTTRTSNPVSKCNTNRKYLLNLFGLKTLTLSSIFSSLENPVEYGKKVIKDYGLDQSVFNRIIEDSVTRHFYGAEDSFPEKDVLKIKQKHVDTAFMSLALGHLLSNIILHLFVLML